MAGVGLRHSLWVSSAEQFSTTLRNVDLALERGASVSSHNAVRGENGEMERHHAAEHFAPLNLTKLELVLDGCQQFTTAVVTADLWDIDQLPACEHCRMARVERLRRLNACGGIEPRVVCDECSTA